MMGDRKLDPSEVAAALAALPGWELHGDTIRRVYRTDGWRGSMLTAGP